jgi:hypothetical protein
MIDVARPCEGASVVAGTQLEFAVRVPAPAAWRIHLAGQLLVTRALNAADDGTSLVFGHAVEE